MELKVLMTIFITIFLSELGDKSQIAALLFSAEAQVSKWLIFFAVSFALVIATAISVGLGGLIGKYIDPKVLSYVAGSGFVLIGLWTLITA